MKLQNLFLVLLICMTFLHWAVAQEADFGETNPATIVGLLRDANTLGDLEVTAEQTKKLKEIDSELKEALKIEFRKPVGSRKPSIAYNAAVRKMTREILLPHQQARLVQLINRRALLYRFDGDYSRLLTELMAKQIGLSEKQKSEIEAIHENGKEELANEISEFQKRIGEIVGSQRDNSLKVLNEEQVATVRRSLGEEAWGVPPEMAAQQILEDYIRKLKRQPASKASK